MGFLVSPGVEVNEIDLTNVIPAVSTSIGGIVGNFQWGPGEQVVSIGSEKDLVALFGKPSDDTYEQWLQAAAFLQYGNSLKVYRYIPTGAGNATASGTAITIKNADGLEDAAFGVDDSFAARYPGALGDSLKVEVYTPSNFSTMESDTDVLSRGSFDSTPAGSERHIAVVDEDGDISGTAGTILETFAFVDTTAGAKKDGASNYYIDVINSQSAYVYTDTDAHTDITTDASASVELSLSGAADGTAGTSTQLSTAYTTAFSDDVDVNLLIAPASNTSSDSSLVITVAETRRDCVAIVSPGDDTKLQSDTATAVSNTTTWADAITSSSYGILGSTMVYVYDKYNDKYRWIGCAGHIAGLCANTDDVAEPWFSPAGYNRGQFRGIVKLGYSPNQVQRDDLYKKRVNPIVSFPGQGTVLFGDKTALSKPSAFDRINVRRLFIVLEKAISTAAKYQLFELNDEFTRAMFRNMTEPFLRDVKGRRGIYDFAVICDETNNTGEVIDTNRFVADIYIKPARSINFITLNFIATRTGVEFSEIVGK